MGGKSRPTLSSGIARALQDVAKVIARHEGRAAIIGGIAVIAPLYGSRVDLERIRRHVKQLGDALEIDRLRDFDAVVARISKD